MSLVRVASMNLGRLLEHGQLFRGYTTEESDCFSFQLSIVSQGGMGPTKLSLVLFMSCVLHQSWSEFMSTMAMTCPEDVFFVAYLLDFWSLQS